MVLERFKKYTAKQCNKKPVDPSIERQEKELELLLAKENSFPPVSMINEIK